MYLNFMCKKCTGIIDVSVDMSRDDYLRALIGKVSDRVSS